MAAPFFVADLPRQLSLIAGNHWGHPSQKMSLVGVTGTNGKSTVCSWIEQILQSNGQAAASVGTLGVHACGRQLLDADGMTTRDAIKAQEVLAQCVEAGANKLAIEVSSHGLDQFRIESVCFAVALFTNFTRDHLDYHGSEEEYWQAKKRLFDLPGIRCAVVNIDDEKGRGLAEELVGKMQVLTFSIEGREQADFFLTAVSYADGFHATFHSGDVEQKVHLPQLIAEFELSNLLAAIAASTALDLPLDSALSTVSQLQPAKGRLQLAAKYSNTRIYVDYAHTPDAVARVLAALKASNPEQLIAVLGCGGDRDAGKRPEMARAALSHADRLVITSDNPRSEDPADIERDMLKGVEDMDLVDCISDRRQAIRFAIEQAVPGSCIAVLGKGHESVQIISERQYEFDDAQVAQELVAELSEKSAQKESRQ